MDEASRALIEKLQREDEFNNPYLASAGFESGEDESEEDYRPGVRPAKKRTIRKKAVSKKDEAREVVSSSQEAAAPPVRKPRPKIRWTSEEHNLFLEALELHGRDWKKGVEHLAKSNFARETAFFRSHAQQYFAKLWRDGLPLPDKVRESGEGFTLSGRPLDPDSGMARRALGLGKKEKKTGDCDVREKSAEGDTKVGVSVVESSQHSPADGEVSRKGKSQLMEEVSAKVDPGLSEPREIPPGGARRRQKRKIDSVAGSVDRPFRLTEERTEYCKGKLRVQKREKYSEEVESEAHQLQPCSSYSEGSQPFELIISQEANIIMDLHAHQTDKEVIGFLGGFYQIAARTITVSSAFPCRSVSAHNDNVELDPTAEFEVRKKIRDRSLSVVGWYHSHPTFQPNPSVRDIYNQSNYQSLFEDDPGSGPFVAAIIAPYDTLLPTNSSAIHWWHVRPLRMQSVGHPYTLEHSLLDGTVEISEQLKEDLLAIFELGETKVDLNGVWRTLHRSSTSTSQQSSEKPPTVLPPAAEHELIRVTYWEKIKESVFDRTRGNRVPDVLKLVKQRWSSCQH